MNTKLCAYYFSFILVVLLIGLIFQSVGSGTIKCYINEDTSFIESNGDGPYIVWNRTYGRSFGDAGNSVAITDDGGFIICGYVDCCPGNLGLHKIDGSGDVVWERSFGGERKESGYSVNVTSDGGYVVTGYLSIYNGEHYDRHVWLFKSAVDGNIIWEQVFDIGYGLCVQETNDKGFIISGFKGWSSTDILLIKTDPQGNLEWNQTYRGNGEDVGYSVDQTIDGGYIITGSNHNDLWLIKTDDQGNITWDTVIHGSFTETAVGRCVQETIDEGFIITGSMRKQILILKTDATGTVEWKKFFGETSTWNCGRAVKQTIDGGFVLTGKIVSESYEKTDLWIMKLNNSGDVSWNRTFGGIETDSGRDIEQIAEGEFIVVGSTYSFGAGSKDIWGIQLTMGNAPPTQLQITGPTSGKIHEDHEYLITAIDPNVDDLYYFIDWGDGSCEDWDGPYQSGETIMFSHKWNKKSIYIVKAKVKDEFGLESVWITLEVSMSKVFSDSYLLNKIQNFKFIPYFPKF